MRRFVAPSCSNTPGRSSREIAVLNDAKRDWVLRVLGLDTGGVDAAPVPQPDGAAGRVLQAGGPTLAVWQEARDAANDQLVKLQAALRGTRHPMFLKIADGGLNGFTGKFLVGMQVALMNVDQAREGEARAKAAQKARVAIGNVRGFLQSHPVVPLLERNPFKVPVALRAVLIPALEQIERSLGA